VTHKCRPMPNGTALFFSALSTVRPFMFSRWLWRFWTAHCAAPLSCADVQEEATAGSAKPRRKACSTGRGSGQSGAWGNPNKRPAIFKRISPVIACLRYRKFTIISSFVNLITDTLRSYIIEKSSALWYTSKRAFSKTALTVWERKRRWVMWI
jgi:hypothetical protein